jgi:uncharacterized protein (TIRG00374 family)
MGIAHMDEKVFQDLQPHHTGTKWYLRGAWFFGFFILAALILIVLKFGELKNFAVLVRKARPSWLFMAVLLQLLTYVSVASAWRATLAKAEHPVSLSRLVPLGLAKLFTDQAIPSAGMSGNIVVARGLSKRGIPPHLVLTALLLDIIGYYIAYMIMVLTTLFILKTQFKAHTALLSVFSLFAVLAIGIPSLIVWIKRRSDRSLPKILQRIPFSNFLVQIVREVPSELLRDPVLIFKNSCFEAGVFLLDALTLWVILLSTGQTVHPMVPFTVFIAASVVGTVSPLPMGLGTFEAVAVATLGMLGVRIEAALTATLLLRGFTFWLPMLPGLVLVKRELGGRTLWRTMI